MSDALTREWQEAVTKFLLGMHAQIEGEGVRKFMLPAMIEVIRTNADLVAATEAEREASKKAKRYRTDAEKQREDARREPEKERHLKPMPEAQMPTRRPC